MSWRLFAGTAKVGAVLALVVLGACRDAGTGSGGDGEGVLSTRLALNGQDDIATIRVDVFQGATLVASKPVALASSMDAIAQGDAFFTLPAGAYQVTAVPLQSNGQPSAQCMTGGATATVSPGLTTEIMIALLCNGPGSGGLDVLVSTVHNPVITDLSISPSKLAETCQAVDLEVTAQDGDNDPLTYGWSVLSAPPGASFSLVPQGNQARFVAHDAGDYLLGVQVRDPANQIATLSFPIHASGGSCRGLADLTILRAVFSPAPGVDGEAMVMFARVTNLGGVASTPTDIVACSNTDATFCTLPGAVPALAPGAATVVQAVLPAAATAGRASPLPYAFLARVDASGAVAESNEANNTLLSERFFIVVPVVPLQLVEDDQDIVLLLDGATIAASTKVLFPNGGPTDVIPVTPAEKVSAPGELPPSGAADPKVDPLLRKEIAALPPGGRIRALVQMTNIAHFRRLPEVPRGDRFSPNIAPLLASRQAAFEGLRRLRLTDVARQLTSVLGQSMGMPPIVIGPSLPPGTDLQVQAIEFLALSGAIVLEMPPALVGVLEQSQLVRHIDSVNRQGILLDDASTTNDIIDARAQIGTDVYFNAGAEGGGFFFGVIDSGVRITHTMFNAPDQIDFWRDCVNTTSGTCADTGDAAWAPGDCVNHGTKVAGAVNGNSNKGADFRGVADTTMDSWDISTGCAGSVSCTAGQRAMDGAALWGDKVVTNSWGGCGDPSSATSVAADEGYNAGMLMYFANGNSGPGAGTVLGPGNAHKVIGVGAFDVSSGTQYAGQSRGAAPDGRFKPDLQAPTSSETSSNASDTAMGTVCCTSGATPYASSAGLLLTDWFGSFSTTPGLIYAMQLNYGENPAATIDNTEGVGRFRLGAGGSHISGVRSLTMTGQNSYVDFTVPAGTTDLRAAIWWPETDTQSHNDVDLRVEHPAGTSVSSSVFVNAVFEHVVVANPASGSWRIRIRAFSLPTSPQVVYYAIRMGGALF